MQNIVTTVPLSFRIARLAIHSFSCHITLIVRMSLFVVHLYRKCHPMGTTALYSSDVSALRTSRGSSVQCPYDSVNCDAIAPAFGSLHIAGWDAHMTDRYSVIVDLCITVTLCRFCSTSFTVFQRRTSWLHTVCSTVYIQQIQRCICYSDVTRS